MNKKISDYRKTEVYTFHQFQKAINGNNKNHTLKWAYLWLLKLNSSNITITEFIQKYGCDSLKLENQLFISGQSTKLKGSAKAWGIARSAYFSKNEIRSKSTQVLNP